MTPQIARNILRWLFPVAFNFLFFACCGFSDNEISRWIAFAFINLSWFIREYTRLFTCRNKGLKILSYSLHIISTAFFCLTFFLGIIFILQNTPEYGPALVIHTLIFVIYLFIFLPSYIANEHTVNNIIADKNEPALIILATEKLMSNQNDYSIEINKEIKKCIEFLQFSPRANSMTVNSYDQQIIDMVSSLITYAKANDFDNVVKIKNNLNMIVNTRNSILKNSH